MATDPRLLFLEQYGHIGGGQRILLDLVASMRVRGWSPSVLCPQGPLVSEAQKRGAQVHTMELPSMRSGGKSLLSLLRAWIAARRIAQTHRPLAQSTDLLIVNGPRTLAIAREWVTTLHVPAILYLHGVYGSMENFLLRSFLALPRTAAIAASPLIAKPFASLRNVHCIHNWVSQEFLTSPVDTARLRSVLRITDCDPIVLIPGRFSPNKGQLLILEVSRLLGDIRCHFVFSGAPLFEERGRRVADVLQQAVHAHPQRLHMIDWQESLPALFDGADLVLVPSLWEEPFGLTAIEAMARTRPLIVTDRGMLPDLVNGGKVASVVHPTPRAIADAIRGFLAHRGEWKVRAGKSRVFVERQFHPECQQEAVIRMCASLLAP